MRQQPTRNLITDCKSLLALRTKLRARKPIQYHQRSLMACRELSAGEHRWHKAHSCAERRGKVCHQWLEETSGVIWRTRQWSHQRDSCALAHGVISDLQSASWSKYKGKSLLQLVNVVVTKAPPEVTSRVYQLCRD